MLNIGIAIALLVLCSSYKSCPIVSKLTGIKVLTIILTVLASIKLMSFLFGVLPMYYGSESENYHPILSVFASSVFAITVIYYCGVITLSVIACIKGYKCMSNNELHLCGLQRTAESKRRKSTADIPHTICRKCSAELYNRKYRMAVYKLW